ncbi:MAG TPA: phytanoyl-CoA dioxygenase family protein [Phycisphaerales bacterium]|nr:phytanoyl-CoA dioxygenase family protein [Phycisphaerales bacterium]HCD32372.1 phytanoyl-CoA dioxygenase family protein [Phycisphaerales bacterium]|tara:strand:+ start:1266 stop:2189 length:924 start_codon:yes stop_codon:yes gene_type:complete
MTTTQQILPPLTEAQVCDYHANGFLVLEDAFARQELTTLRQETVAICRGQRGALQGAVGDHHDQSDDEVLRQYLCIHFPHKVSPVMLDALKHPNIANALSQVISPDVKCMQSMLFIKAAGKPGQAWHQDEYYIPTRDRSLTGAWIAMDDATVQNGCLWVIPGSHKHGILWPQHSHDDRRFDCAGEAGGYPYTDEDAIPVEVKAGSVVVFNGYLLHRSLPNTAAAGYRRALVNHYMSAQSLLPWHPPQEGQSIATHDCRDIVIVAGNDPYAYKGLQDMAQPHVRPDGKGGCRDFSKDKQGLKNQKTES